MQIMLNHASAEALYQQIARQLKDKISSGRLPAGARLLSIRQLAVDLQVNHLTVERAYSQLRADGWVRSHVGRGTFVQSSAEQSQTFATLECGIDPNNLIADLYTANGVKKLRSLGRAEPDPILTSFDEIWGALSAQRSDSALVGGFSPTEGDVQLRRALLPVLRARGVEADERQVIVTSGATQAIALALLAVTEPGDAVLLPEPTYVGLLHAVRTLGRRTVSLSYDENGDLDLVEAERLMRVYQPRALLMTAAYNNPTGLSCPAATLEALIDLSKQHAIYLIDDDSYGLLSWQGDAPLPLRASECCHSIIYLSSLSKCLMPGLRVGYLVAPPELHDKLLQLKRAIDVMGSPLIQRAAAYFLNNGAFETHLRRVRPIYRRRRDALLNALAEHMPTGTTWITPHGGYAVWVRLPRPIVPQLYRAALAQDIVFAPGSAFTAEPDDGQQLRLCFGQSAEKELQSVVRLLGELIREILDADAVEYG